MRLGDINSLSELFKAEYKQYRWHVVLLGVLSFVGGILEGLGITSIIPIFSFLNSSKGESTDLISQVIERFFTFFNFPYTLKFLLVFILALFVLKAVIIFLANHISAHVAIAYEKNTRKELFSLTLKSDWPSLSKQKLGVLSQILTTDVGYSSAMLSYVSMLLITVINVLVYTLLALNVSVIIAILTLIFGLLIFLIFKPFLYKTKVLSQKVSELYKNLSHYVDESILGVKTIKSMFLEEQIEERGCDYFNQSKDLNIKVAVLKNLTNALLQPLGIVLILAIFAYFYKIATLNFASFAVIVYAINKVFANIQMAQIELHKISTCIPFLAVIVNYKKEARVYTEEDKGSKIFSFIDKLEFKNVYFAYTNGINDILLDVNFRINQGEMVGIIGPSGSGKTTIADLILRLFQPEKGKILVDAEDVQNIKLSQWRTNIGYVSQGAFLVNDTIENNIKFYNDKITKNDIMRVTKMANIYDFIEQLPQKYQTVVGERGVNLSGGQAQRIILARVLATNPRILILDEATSSLDNESELLIQQAIENLKGKITVISIAHRLSTVMSADRLFVIEGGRIIEQGAPEELLKNRDSYLFRVYHLKDNNI